MNSARPYLIGAIALLLVFALGAQLLRYGAYGLTLFAIIPFCVGGIAVSALCPATALGAMFDGALSVILVSSLTLLSGSEGLLCILMAIPLGAPLGALGGLAIHVSRQGTKSSHAAWLLLLPVMTMGWNTRVPPATFQVRTAIVIGAPPDVVWRHVVSFSDLPEPGEWYFRAGLAYPQRARIVGSGPGAIRYCEFSTGPFVEPIEVWNEPALLRFKVTRNPPPLREWSPYRKVLPRHLEGNLVSNQGEFRLTPLAQNRTLLEGTTWYRHSLRPEQYWRWWSDAIIHRIHLRVLHHIQQLSETDALRLPQH
jgi:hypothetical protein